MSTEVVDCRRLLCPMPVIRVQNAVEELTAGTLVEAVCTDPGALKDIPAWCRINGHQLLQSEERDKEYVFLVEKGSDET